jgi:antitoxin component YwqK of YwqJK toxin-antitoxin module
MALELIPSRRAALRNEYCLSLEKAAYVDIPELLLSHYDNSYGIELRVLYKEGAEFRRQWIFRDGRGTVRLSASGSGGFFGGEIFFEKDSEESSDEEKKAGFIEIRNSDGTIVREIRFDEDLSEWEFRFFYRDKILLRTETWFKKPPPAPLEEDESPDETVEGDEDAVVKNEIVKEIPVLLLAYTDTFRYNRSGSLRAIDRVLHEGAGEKLRTTFPRIGTAATEVVLITHGTSFTSEFLSNADVSAGAHINYSLDNRGRILAEVWRDEAGKVIGEFRNTWSGDRLQSVLWKSQDEERLIEYEYDDDGDRIVERNFRQGVLERNVIKENNMEIEEIYLNGRLLLRAYWEDGIKVSEERVNSPAGRPR